MDLPSRLPPPIMEDLVFSGIWLANWNLVWAGVGGAVLAVTSGVIAGVAAARAGVLGAAVFGGVSGGRGSVRERYPWSIPCSASVFAMMVRSVPCAEAIASAKVGQQAVAVASGFVVVYVARLGPVCRRVRKGAPS